MKIKIYQILALFFFLNFYLAVSVSLAQSPTPTATPPPTATDETTTLNLKKRIQKVVEENQDKIKGLANELSQTKIGFIGQIDRVSNESISVKTIKNTRILALSDQTKLMKNNKTLKVSDLTVGDWVTVLGLAQQNNFLPLQISVSDKNLRSNNYIAKLGSIIKVETNSILFQPRGENDTITLILTKATKYQDLIGTTIKKPQLSNDWQVLLIYTDSDEGNKTIKTMRILSEFSN